jgi:SPP1 family predicted phage head-tail adaptor
VWGSLRPLTGKEIEAANQIHESINYRAMIRYHATIASEWRIIHGSDTYEVLSILNIDEIDRMQQLELKRIT